MILLMVLAYSLAMGSTNAPADRGQSKTERFLISFSSTSDSIRLTTQPTVGKSHRVIVSPARNGDLLQVIQQTREGSNSWQRQSLSNLVFWPSEPRNIEVLEQDGIERQSCLHRSLMLRLDYDDNQCKIWLEGQLISTLYWQGQPETQFEITATGNTVVNASSTFSRKEIHEQYELVEIPGLNPTKSSSQLIHVNGIPFEMWDNGNTELSLDQAGWPDWQRDPAGFNQAYDGGTYFIGDIRMPSVQIPNTGFSHAYILARVEKQPESINRFTLRIGRRVGGYTSHSQVVTRDYLAEVPLDGSPDFGAFQLIRIPIHELFPMLVEGEILDMEITKEIRLARRQPDPNSFRWRPLGMPSNVKIAAITLQKSPLQMQVNFPHHGKVFEEGEVPNAKIILTNTGSSPVPYQLDILSGADAHQQLDGEVDAHSQRSLTVETNAKKLGIYPFHVKLKNQKSEVLLDYQTTYGILPSGERKYRTDSPLGIGGAGTGRHFTPLDPDASSALVSKLGFHYVNSLDIPYESRHAHGLKQGFVLSMRPGNGGAEAILKRWEERLTEHPDQLRQLLILHEDGISGAHASRIPDIFHDRPSYQLDEEEQKRFSMLFENAVKTGKLFREHHPDVEIQLGNGNIVVREEFYRQGLPGELFDTAGNENPTFSRYPEVQPPDTIGNNSSLWMDRQLLDHYGFTNKPVTQCHETIFPSSNPGNLSYATQANYLVRHFLHSMAWEMPQIRGAGLYDKGNSYKNSNWGQTGLFTARPDVSPKPAALHMAVFTKIMDGATYEDFLDTGSESVYLMRFKLRDNSWVLPFWTIRGQRPIYLDIPEVEQAVLITGTGEEQYIDAEHGKLTITASATTGYLKLPEHARIQGIQLGNPQYTDDLPEGKITVLDALSDQEQWVLQQEKNAILEFYNPLTPRRKGNFEIKPVNEFEGKNHILKITPRPLNEGKPTMPMYAELRAASPVPMSGKPVEIGLWVNGNSSSGRIIFELQDASGQKWTSVGARSKRGGSPWMADWLGKELADQYEPGERSDWNTDDAWGLSRINFDGWHYVGMPLPGNYPGELYPWPANSQWRWDKDGVVHYPWTVTAIFIELPEKTLHLKRYEAPRRKEIYIHNLISIENDQMHSAKTVSGEAVESKQMHID